MSRELIVPAVMLDMRQYTGHGLALCVAVTIIVAGVQAIRLLKWMAQYCFPTQQQQSETVKFALEPVTVRLELNITSSNAYDDDSDDYDDDDGSDDGIDGINDTPAIQDAAAVVVAPTKKERLRISLHALLDDLDEQYQNNEFPYIDIKPLIKKHFPTQKPGEIQRLLTEPDLDYTTTFAKLKDNRMVGPLLSTGKGKYMLNQEWYD